ncbi:MAG: hypothetical protein OER88_11670, partial [Planctomycetota bacterium]|nr:hypothetical protein [Planctomycetota bacterium]
MPRRRPRAQPKTSSTQVAVAVGGAVLFVLGIAVLQPWKSGSEPAPAPVANKPTDKPPPRSRDMIRRDEAREWYRKTFLDDYESPRRLEGAEVQRLIEEGERLYGQVPKLEWKQMKRRVYKSLLRREPYHPGANREFGKFPLHDYPGFFRLFEKM